MGNDNFFSVKTVPLFSLVIFLMTTSFFVGRFTATNTPAAIQTISIENTPTDILISSVSTQEPSKETLIRKVENIAFVRGGDIYSASINGSDQKKLTNYGHNFHPSISPDGKKIAYLSVAKEVTDKMSGLAENNIWIIGVDGTNPVKITEYQKGVQRVNPSWSYDSQYLVYIEGEKVMLYDSSSGNSKAIYTGSKMADNYWPSFGVPKWISDKNKLVFARRNSGGLYFPVVVDVTANTYKEYKDMVIHSFYKIDWISDDEIIYFTSIVEAGRSLYKAIKHNLSTDLKTEIAGQYEAIDFSISPDKKYLAINEYFGTGGSGSVNNLTIISMGGNNEVVYKYPQENFKSPNLIDWLPGTSNLEIIVSDETPPNGRYQNNGLIFFDVTTKKSVSILTDLTDASM